MKKENEVVAFTLRLKPHIMKILDAYGEHDGIRSNGDNYDSHTYPCQTGRYRIEGGGYTGMTHTETGKRRTMPCA